MNENTQYIASGWADILRAGRLARRRQWARARGVIRYNAQYLRGQARRRNWRAIRNALWKPYRCESVSDSPRVGWGWTAGAARRDLTRRLAEMSHAS